MSKIKFKVSPELHDGDNFGLLRDPMDVARAVQAWAESYAGFDDEMSPGETITITAFAMTDSEYDAIPEE